MILELNRPFENFTPVGVIEQTFSYREVYKAVNGDGKEFALIVYDMNALPECFAKCGIAELDVIPLLSCEVFPEFVQSGDVQTGDVSLRWGATKYINGISMTECIRQGIRFEEADALEKFNSILLGVQELSMRMNGGSHNNINTDNIIVGTLPDGSQRWYLTGLNCVSEPCNGRVPFDVSVLKREFCAPETSVGIFRQTADVFSLGVVLCCILQHKHPWQHLLSAVNSFSALDLTACFREVLPRFDYESLLFEIIGKAVSSKPSERFSSVKSFREAIRQYVENDFQQTGSKFKEEQNLPAQPVSNVVFERKVGNGFKDVAGMNELKNNLACNFIDIVNNRELAEKFHISPVNTTILFGPPGNGKSFIAGKLAEEAQLPYAIINPSDLGSIYMHGSQNMIADLFNKCEEEAKRNKRGVLLVFEEFDSLVPRRDSQGNNHQENEVAEFLTRLNNCAEKGIYVIATTNRIDSIDPAISRRRGRADLIIYVGLPDDEARRELLELELEKRPHEHIDLDLLVKLTDGYTSSDISYVVKECARRAFEKSIKTDSLVKITQQLMENVISNTMPSVTSEELREYEKSRDAFSKVKKGPKSRIGYSRY